MWVEILRFGAGGGVRIVTESRPSALSLSQLFLVGILLNTLPGDFPSVDDRVSNYK